MTPWHSSRYDRLIANVRAEMRGVSMLSQRWCELDVRLSRLSKSQRSARNRETREANPRFCSICGGGLHTHKSYQRGWCIECRDPADAVSP